MCTREVVSALAAASALALLLGTAQAQDRTRFGFGAPVSDQELTKYFSYPADGTGLPSGSGTGEAGAKVYAETCAACHGEKLEGNSAKGIGGDKLIGGRGTLESKAPVKTVESYWPYATTLFDYKRAMPFSSPGSLSDDQVYSVVAYVLSEAKIIKPTDVMDAKTLPQVEMPNRDGFEPDPRPELDLYR
jgi:mono/diheme cytochrome c family protein